MKKVKYTLINEDTGEMIDFTDIKRDMSNGQKITKMVIDNMLNNAKNLEDIDIKLLFQWMKIKGLVNQYSQLKVNGAYRDKEVEKEMIKDITLYGYINRIMLMAHPFSNVIMVNRKRPLDGWLELWELIGCTDRRTRAKIKSYIKDNDLIREVVVIKKDIKTKKFILNPFMFRGANYTSQIALSVYDDMIEEGVNLDTYIVRFLQATGLIGVNK